MSYGRLFNFKIRASCDSRLQGRNLALSSTPRNAHTNGETQHNRAVCHQQYITGRLYKKTLTCEILLHPIEVNLAQHQNTSNRSQVTCEQTQGEPPNCKTSVSL